LKKRKTAISTSPSALAPYHPLRQHGLQNHLSLSPTSLFSPAPANLPFNQMVPTTSSSIAGIEAFQFPPSTSKVQLYKTRIYPSRLYHQQSLIPSFPSKIPSSFVVSSSRLIIPKTKPYSSSYGGRRTSHKIQRSQKRFLLS